MTDISQDTIIRLDERARMLSEHLTDALEAYDPKLYDRIYWLVCGISDYLTPLLEVTAVPIPARDNR